jgi:hypothetical protein
MARSYRGRSILCEDLGFGGLGGDGRAGAEWSMLLWDFRGVVGMRRRRLSGEFIRV